MLIDKKITITFTVPNLKVSTDNLDLKVLDNRLKGVVAYIEHRFQDQHSLMAKTTTSAIIEQKEEKPEIVYKKAVNTLKRKAFN